MKEFRMSLIVLLLAGVLAACSNGTTIMGNPPDNPLPQLPGEGTTITGNPPASPLPTTAGAFTKAVIEANKVWKDDASAEETAEYFVEFAKEGEVNIYPTDDGEYFSLKYIIKLDGSVASLANDGDIGLIGAVNEDVTALNMWLISKEGSVVATLTSDITEEDKATLAEIKCFLFFGCDQGKAKEAKDNAPGGKFGPKIDDMDYPTADTDTDVDVNLDNKDVFNFMY
jgi:hypothetical protein